MSIDKELQKRERKAEALGEGAWRNPKTDEWCRVDVTFYPTVKLWITENNKRREITRAELKRDYHQLEL